MIEEPNTVSVVLVFEGHPDVLLGEFTPEETDDLKRRLGIMHGGLVKMNLRVSQIISAWLSSTSRRPRVDPGHPCLFSRLEGKLFDTAVI